MDWDDGGTELVEAYGELRTRAMELTPDYLFKFIVVGGLRCVLGADSRRGGHWKVMPLIPVHS